ncbi:polysaccharide lyase [Niallia circulans]|nr:polysaccharide lyase [Niallia circulans]
MSTFLSPLKKVMTLSLIPLFIISHFHVEAKESNGEQDAETPVKTNLSRQMERLDRAPYAIQTEDGIYVSWRMLGTDSYDIAFNLYRDHEKINEEPIVSSTNFVDADGNIDSSYEIIPVIDGEEKPDGTTVNVMAENFLDIPIQRPEGGVTPMEKNMIIMRMT